MSDEIMIAGISYRVLALPGRQPALLDRVVADIYCVETREVNQAVDRNLEKFSDDFMFNLSDAEVDDLKSQIVISNPREFNRGNPRAFLLGGCNMLATILKSDIAVRRSVDIIRAFTKMECGQYYASAAPLEKSLKFMSSEVVAAVRLMKAFKVVGNQGILAANKIIVATYGKDYLKMAGQELKSEVQERYQTVTELGKLLTPPRSANAMNTLLESGGLQTQSRTGKDKLVWNLTDTGKKYGQYFDVGKQHSNGTPIQQIKWRATVLTVVEQHLGTHCLPKPA